MVNLNRKVVRPQSGKREDLGGLFFRSAMEANVARVFEALRQRAAIIAWWYEPHVFTFAHYGFNRGPWAYTPDFLVQWNILALDSGWASWPDTVPGKRPKTNIYLPVVPGESKSKTTIRRLDQLTGAPIRGEYFEIKGRELGSDRSKAKRMKKVFPGVQVTQIGKQEYRGLETFWSRMLPNWEGGRRCRK